jgi:hypothetical protein
MLTPKLEEWILCGKAFFKTFVAGGDKHTLTFGNDRFIIITDITYMPMNCPTNFDGDTRPNKNTQVAIYGERGYNHYIFRNYNLDLPNDRWEFTSPITINTYLLHEQQVGFSFCNASRFQNLSLGVANTENPAYQPPIEFGKDGQPGAVPTILTMDAAGAIPIQNNFTTRPVSGVNESQQLLFPFDTFNQFGNALDQNDEYPILLVNYVEVIGSANNIQI